MMDLWNNKKWIAFYLVTIFIIRGTAQTNVPQGINFQGIARNADGTLIANKSVSIKLGIYSKAASDVLEWEETHATTTNQFGLFRLIIGQGTSTGNGAKNSFSAINWAAASHYIKTAIDPAGGTSYVTVDTTSFWSVPYALHSGSSGKVVGERLNDLTDVDTVGVKNGYVLKWDGTIWKPAKDNDSDTASFADKTNHSTYSDTASFVLNAKHTVYADTALYALKSKTAIQSTNSNYCDTAVYALNVVNGGTTSWRLTGNTGTDPATNFLGTIDSKDFVIKTNNTERLRILANGKVGIGSAAPSASFQVNGVDGILASGTFGSGTTVSPGAGTRMHWYPKKAAFRAGYVSSTQWDDAKIGNYSFATGSGNTASGAFSIALGEGSLASGNYSIAMGNGCQGGKTSSIAMGSNCIASGEFAVALGRGITASDSAAVGIGYHSMASGKYSLALGAYTEATGAYSTTMGYYASSNGKRGSFVYADNSSGSQTLSTVDNQFLVRASGGVIFYSNTALTVGVSLPAGGGSWASVSDRNKKEHFSTVDGERILQGIKNLEITAWNYKTQASSIKHIGPMAQDLYKEFGFGESELTITAVDLDGINLIALKTLALKTEALKKDAAEFETLKLRIVKLEKEKALLEKRISEMEHQMEVSSK